jgi:hypothetical protein
MNLPAPIASKISKLLPLLASDKDGEVLGAARAIHRTLQSAGADLHDLAARLSTDNDPPAPELDADPPPQAQKPPSWGKPAAPCRWGDLSPDERKDALGVISTLPLSEWEWRFVANITGLIHQTPRGSLSPKQVEILNRLLRRVWEVTP